MGHSKRNQSGHDERYHTAQGKRNRIQPIHILLVGILVLIAGLYLWGRFPDHMEFGILGGIGGFLILLVISKWRNQLNDWIDNK